MRIIKYKGVKIRHRERMDASPAAGLSQLWVEYQVLGENGKILHRADTMSLAKKWIDDNE